MRNDDLSYTNGAKTYGNGDIQIANGTANVNPSPKGFFYQTWNGFCTSQCLRQIGDKSQNNNSTECCSCDSKNNTHCPKDGISLDLHNINKEKLMLLKMDIVYQR